MDPNQEFKHIVRIANTDVDGNKPIGHALTSIKGISFMFSNLVCRLAHVDKSKKSGTISDDELKRLDDIIKDPQKFGAPEWFFNRRKDPEDNISRHLISVNLTFTQSNDIKLMRKIKSYKGVRHSLGLPVRGQRTRSNFRKNKGKVHLGVQRKGVAKPEGKGK